MVNIYEFSGKHPPILSLSFQTSERSFYYGEIIKTSKTRMRFLYKSRNGQANIQQPLPKMQKQMQAKL